MTRRNCCAGPGAKVDAPEASSGPGWKIQEVSRVGAQGVTSKPKLLAREMPRVCTEAGPGRYSKCGRPGRYSKCGRIAGRRGVNWAWVRSSGPASAAMCCEAYGGLGRGSGLLCLQRRGQRRQ